MDNKKPLHFLVLKIVGAMGIAAAIVGIVLSVSGFGDFESNKFMIGSLLTTFGLFVGISCLVSGFRPELTRMSLKSAKYIQNENKDELGDIINTSAEIAKDAISTTVGAIKDGLAESCKYCKHCGALIDADSKFCSKCGKEQ